MTLWELYKRCQELLFVEGVDPGLALGNKDPYGEFEEELEGLEVRRRSWKRDTERYVLLVGMPSKYPDPD